MLLPPADRPRLSHCSQVALLVLTISASLLHAQQNPRRQLIQIAPGRLPLGIVQADPRKIELTSPHVDLISGNMASRLEQVRALVADKNWDEAIDILRDLSTEKTDRVVAIEDNRYVNVRTYCQRELSRMPPDALVAYRRRVDSLADRWYRDGLAERDAALLKRVVNELFCSSWGDDALLALGELALERGDYAAARRYWEQITPLARDPNGKPLWISLRGVDLDKHWPEIQRRWPLRTQPPAWLVYPDSAIDVAQIRAQLVLVSIRAGEFDRAAVELDAFRRWHPTATGRLGGQEGPFATALERLLASAKEWPAPPLDRNWPTFAGALSRSPNLEPLGPLGKTAWAQAQSITPDNVVRVSTSVRPHNLATTEAPVTRESERPLNCFPVVVGGTLLYSDVTTVKAAALATGKPAITPDGTLFQVEPTQGDMNAAMMRSQFIAAGAPRHSLTVIDGIVYARVGKIQTARLQPEPSPIGERLVGIDLRRDGLLTFQARPDDDRWSFDGVPVGDGSRVYIAMRHSDVTPHAYVACFDVATGRRLWRTSIGSADTPSAVSGDEITHNLLSLVGERIYFNTNLGLVVALDADDGHIQWLRQHPRNASASSTAGLGGPLYLDRDPSPCLVHQGIVIAAPSDTPAVFALDAETGLLLWSTDKLADGLHLLGVSGDSLIITGNRICSVDLRSGRIRFAWPESEHAGIRGIGRGVLAGNEVFWPTRKEIYVFDAQTGVRTRAPIDLSNVSSAGANLVAADGHLVVAGRERLIATGPVDRSRPSDTTDTPKVAEAN